MLEVSQLAAGYGKIEVLHGLNFQVPKGQVITLIGSNGAGKTTTMRAISGMIQPRAGSIKLNGREIGGLDSYEVARSGLAHSPEGRRVFPTLSVEDNLTLGA
ncbi:MAG TPA: ATP-binding cassette domain-containing protein, partial [Enterovirga sp.]|nr:ATP-binding cassette domain-containing protein [Enterovirga sp.]